MIEPRKQDAEIVFSDHLKRGHSVFEINPLEMTCELAQIEHGSLKNLNDSVKMSNWVKIKAGHFYVCALNKTTAMKKFVREYASDIAEKYTSEQKELAKTDILPDVLQFAYNLDLEHGSIKAMKIAEENFQKYKADSVHDKFALQKMYMWSDVVEGLNHIVKVRNKETTNQ